MSRRNEDPVFQGLNACFPERSAIFSMLILCG